MTHDADNGKGRLHEFPFGSHRIRCSVTFGNRTRIRVVVHPDLTVQVRAPRTCPLTEALEWTRRRAAWILRQQSFFAQFPPPPTAKRYSPGETFWYLGRQYRLKVEQEQPQGVKLRGRFLWVVTAERDNPGRTMQLIDEWYRVRSHEVFERRLDCCMQIAERFGIKRPRMRRRRMVRRWGSCKVKGGILLNRDLVKAPVHCIDYVIMHELCHVRIPNHSRRFYDLLGQMMPDWEQRKARLEKAGR